MYYNEILTRRKYIKKTATREKMETFLDSIKIEIWLGTATGMSSSIIYRRSKLTLNVERRDSVSWRESETSIQSDQLTVV